MTTNTEQQTQVDTESTHVGTGFAANPEDTEMAIVVVFDQLAFVDSSYTQLALDGGNKWRTLEQSASQGFDRLRKE